MRIFGERDLTQQGIRDFAQSQDKYHKDDGNLNAVYPNGDGKRYIVDWTQSWVFWLWDYWIQTGDRELTGDLIDAMVRVVEFIHSKENKTSGLIDLGDQLDYSGGIVDWPDRYNYDRGTTQRSVISANAYLAYTTAAKLAAEFKRPDAARRFSLRSRIHAAIFRPFQRNENRSSDVIRRFESRTSGVFREIFLQLWM